MLVLSFNCWDFSPFTYEPTLTVELSPKLFLSANFTSAVFIEFQIYPTVMAFKQITITFGSVDLMRFLNQLNIFIQNHCFPIGILSDNFLGFRLTWTFSTVKANFLQLSGSLLELLFIQFYS